MAFFQDVHKSDAVSAYRRMKSYLAPKDGRIHVMMINSFSKVANEIFGCETKYTSEVDTIITMMQEDGYEILDVKMNSIQDQGLMGQREGFHTLITYRSPERVTAWKSDEEPEEAHDPDAPKIVKVEDAPRNASFAKKDWTCKICGAVNDKDRRSCRECGSPK